MSCIDFTQPLLPDAPRLRCQFGAPRQVLRADAPTQVRAVLDAVHAAARQGSWCVGYVRYEAAAAFDAALHTHLRAPSSHSLLPLACLAQWTLELDGLPLCAELDTP